MTARRSSVDGDIDLAEIDGLRQAWTAHAPELLGYARQALNDPAAADEAVQDTFVRAWRAADSFDRTRALRPWLFAILRNVIIDIARSRSRRSAWNPRSTDRLNDDPQRIAQPPLDDRRLDAMFDEWMLHEAFRRLRDDQRTILVEAFYRGRPYADIARELSIPEGTVRSRVFYALRTLRLVLEEMGWES